MYELDLTRRKAVPGECQAFLMKAICNAQEGYQLCIEWPFNRGKSNHPRIDRHKEAHVRVWEIFNGRKRKKELVVHHKCDNPPCINPNHLEETTVAINTQLGVRCVLTLAQVEAARNEACENGTCVEELAERLEISHGTMWSAINGKSWKNAGGPIAGVDYKPKRKQHVRTKNGLTQEQIADIVQMRKDYRDRVLDRRHYENKYSWTPTKVTQIVRGQIYKYVDGPIVGVDYEETETRRYVSRKS